MNKLTNTLAPTFLKTSLIIIDINILTYNTLSYPTHILYINRIIN